MDSNKILFEKTLPAQSLTKKCEDLSTITISNKPLRISSKGPIMISNEPTVAPLIITNPEPIPYSSNKAVPWNYGAEVFYHGIKQDAWIEEEKADDVSNITGSSKVTRTRRIFSPNISPPVVTKARIRITAAKPSTDTRGKEKVVELVVTKIPVKDVANGEPSAREMDEILKIIKRSDFEIVEQLGKTPSKISML